MDGTLGDPDVEQVTVHAARPLRSGDRIDRYLIVDVLGKGGMGVVYSAYDPDLDRKVALKLLRRAERGTNTKATEAQRRLLREAQAMAKLTHPNVVTVFDVGTFEGQVFFAMEFLSGQTLRSWMEKERPWRDVLRVFRQAGAGLAAAHAIDMVHRDFKPDNVLFGDDGRVSVLDFGLARAERQESAEFDAVSSSDPTHPSGVTLEDLTRTGALLGTPAYMAPEQHLRQPTDARSDQFSFCLTLYEALYGQRAFSGRNHAALALEVAEGNVREVPRDSGVPSWVRQVVLRGLRPDPEGRWSSMDALLAELTRDPAARRRRFAVGGAGVAALILTTIGVTQWQQKQAEVCGGGEVRISSAWSEARREGVRRAFVATDLPFADSTYGRVEARLNAYANQWVAQYVEACAATNVRKEQSTELLDRRVACLDQRRSELNALVGVFEHADREVVSRSVNAVASLPAISRCGDIAALTAAVAPPDDPVVAQRIESLRDQLAEAHAHEVAGRYDAGLALMADVDPSELDYCPARAEAHYRHGMLNQGAGNYTVSAASLEDAFFSAESCNHADVKVAASVALVQVTGVYLERSEPGHRWARQAQASLDAAGRSGSASAVRLLTNLGNLHRHDGEYEQGLVHGEEALSMAREVLGDDHPHVAVALNNIGGSLYQLGRYDAAKEKYELAITETKRLLGEDHPDIATTLTNLANVASDRGKYDEALERYDEGLALEERALGAGHPRVAQTLNDKATMLAAMGRSEDALAVHQRALEIRRARLSPDHANIAQSLNNIANVEGDLGHYEDALAGYREALEIFERTLGPDHPSCAAAINNIGIMLDDQGKYDEAIEHYERAMAIKSNVVGPDHESNATTLNNLGAAHEVQGHHERALHYYGRAVSVWEKALGEEHPILAYPLTGIGSTEVSRGRPEKAIAPLERALRLRQQSEAPPKEVAVTQFALARAMWSDRARRDRSRELASIARATFVETGLGAQRELELLDAWIKAHR
jgi:tetratricopeptide (TPR) repeat protein/predicted Ser/Thr protein kinase